MRSRSLASIVMIAAVLAPAGVRAATTSCNIPQPCAEFANNNGIALEGASAGADGVLGEASSGTIYGAGIEGESLKHTGADAAGTFGLTLLTNGVAPNYGVVAYGSLYGVYGQAGNTGLSKTGPGFGVFGQDNAGSSSGDYNVGVTGLSANNVGVLAEGNGSPTQSTYGSGAPIGLYAVAKKNGSGNSTAIVAESDVLGEVVTNTSTANILQIATSNDYLEGLSSFVLNPGEPPVNSDRFIVDYSGNEYLAGKLTAVNGVTSVHGGPYLQMTGTSGKTVTAYSEHTTTPEIEDFGEAQLVNGRAFVPIDAGLADVVDLRGGYHVVVTPEGDSNGLYVVKGAGGFLVREQHGGRSTLAFEYRLVAKPREERGERLARVTGAIPPQAEAIRGEGVANPQRVPLPLSPEERLKRKIGPRAYAEIIAALSKRFAAVPSR